MTLTPADLDAVWNDLAARTAPGRRFRSTRLAAAAPLGAHAGLRTGDEALCLLIDEDMPHVSAAEFEVGGMRLYRAPSDGAPLLVLSLEEPSRRDLFAKVCADIIAAAVPGGPEALQLFLGRLDAWRLFLKDVRPALSRSDMLGLMGELIVLDRLLEEDPALLEAWRAPDDGLHDFEWRGHALEIKATAGAGSQIGISRLDQLDNAGLGRLDLLLLRLAEDPDGASLSDMTAGLEARLPSESQRRAFRNMLLRRGVNPERDPASEDLRVTLQSQMAWTIAEEFPRLLRADLPAAITEARYLLDPRALTPWACDPDDAVRSLSGAPAHG